MNRPWTFCWLSAICASALALLAGCGQDSPNIPSRGLEPRVNAMDEQVALDVRDPTTEITRETAARDEAGEASEAPNVPVPHGEDPQRGAEDGDAASSVTATTDKHIEPLFVDWPEPEFVLYVTGRQHGYIEPCGCAGLATMKGGLVRRYSLQNELAKRGWEVIPLDVGNQVRRFGRQAEIKFQMTIEGMKQMNYRAIGFGPDDLRLSVGELIAITASEGDTSSPFLCANAAVIDPSLTPRYHLIEAAGRRIGVTAVLGTEELEEISSDEIVKQAPDEALREVWSELEKADCDLYVLLAHTSIEDTKALAQQFPHFDLVVTAGGAGEPTFQAEPIPDTDSVMIQVGTKGMYVGVVGIFDDPEHPLRYQRTPLDSRFPDSPEMLQLLASYQDQLKTAGLEGLGVRPIPHPSGRTFVGSDRCEECHDAEYDIWKVTPHSHALDSLVNPGERSEIPRHFDPECISCHVVGWNPQKYFPYKSGYLGLDETPLMHNVGCENCHGPGSAHVAAEAGDVDATDEELEELMEEMRLPYEEAEKKCMDCHDLDNSPDFHVEGAFEEYWEQVEH